MNKCYFVPDQGVVVKICATAESARREVEGARVFRKIVITSEPKVVDSRTVLMKIVEGEPSPAFSDQIVNVLVRDLLRRSVAMSLKTEMRTSAFSIQRLIDELIKKYAYSQDILRFLTQLQKDIELKPLVPIHGDLQKENMLISPSGELIVIDFEHFCYAPIEFELVNSMFHSDGNCLDIQFQLSELRKITDISDELIRKALVLYALRRV